MIFKKKTMFSGAKAISRNFIKEERQMADEQTSRCPSLLVTRGVEMKTAPR